MLPLLLLLRLLCEHINSFTCPGAGCACSCFTASGTAACLFTCNSAAILQCFTKHC